MFAAQPLLQVEEGQFLSVLERHDLAVENDLILELTGSIGQFRKLVRHPAQIARKDFYASRSAMKLRADPVEFVLHVNHRRCSGGGGSPPPHAPHRWPHAARP